MQGIQQFHFKSLQQYLQKLLQDDLFNLPCEHVELIKRHEEKLNELYTNYLASLERVSHAISQFEDHKRSIRRLIIHHKQCKKVQRKRPLPPLHY